MDAMAVSVWKEHACSTLISLGIAALVMPLVWFKFFPRVQAAVIVRELQHYVADTCACRYAAWLLPAVAKEYASTSISKIAHTFIDDADAADQDAERENAEITFRASIACVCIGLACFIGVAVLFLVGSHNMRVGTILGRVASNVAALVLGTSAYALLLTHEYSIDTPTLDALVQADVSRLVVDTS